MGGIVKAITKPFQSVFKAVGLGSAPQTINNTTTQAAPAAQQQQVTPTTTSADTDTGTSSERVNRRGKRSLTIRRTNVGGGSGLNV